MSFKLEKIFASLPKTERGKPIVLGADPKGKTFLYVNGTSVIIRNVEDCSESDVYTQHSVAATVAKYSPSGFYIASADISGKLRIWDTTQSEHILKAEYHVISGIIKDLAWSADSQRIVVGGEGREKMGAAIMMDTGASVGEILGHSKAINSVDLRSQRPFRAVSASEDFLVCFHEGPPFKFKKQNNEHTNFVNICRFSPNGDVFATGGAEGLINLYDGQSGELKGQFGEPAAHKGGVYSLAFSPDSKKLLSASADKSAKVWDVESRQVEQEHIFGKDLTHMQVGCLWIGDQIITLSLSGFLNFFNASQGGLNSPPHKVIYGHNKPITSLSGVLGGGHKFATAASDGGVAVWDGNAGTCVMLEGNNGHKNQVQALRIADDLLVTVGIDDVVIFSCLSEGKFGVSEKLGSQPRGVASSGNLVAIATLKEILLYDVTDKSKPRKLCSKATSYGPECVTINPDQTILAVGGTDDTSIHIYALSGKGSSISEGGPIIKMTGAVTDIAFSPDGSLLANSDTSRKVSLFTVDGGHMASGDVWQCPHPQEWTFHTARVNKLAWSPDSQHIVSGALDCAIIVWSVSEPKKRIHVTNAHPMSQITGVAWLDNNTVVSAGQDSSVKKWKFTF